MGKSKSIERSLLDINRYALSDSRTCRAIGEYARLEIERNRLISYLDKKPAVTADILRLYDELRELDKVIYKQRYFLKEMFRVLRGYYDNSSLRDTMMEHKTGINCGKNLRIGLVDEWLRTDEKDDFNLIRDELELVKIELELKEEFYKIARAREKMLKGV